MNTRFISTVAASIALFGAGCGGASTATPDDLAGAVVAAPAAGDVDGYLASTVITGDQALAVCPKESFVVDVSDFRNAFNDCRTKFDFTGATVTATDYRLKTTPVNYGDCGNTEPVHTVDSIHVTVSAGGRSYTLKIDDSVETPDGWRQTDNLNCD